MHISDGVLSLEVTVVSTTVATLFLIYSFKNLSNDKIALASAFSALFFVASFIHIPFGPTQIHLMLLGFIGVFLGSVAIFSISLALIFQTIPETWFYSFVKDKLIYNERTHANYFWLTQCLKGDPVDGYSGIKNTWTIS